MRIRSATLAFVSGSFAILLVAAPVLADLTSVSGSAYGEYVNVTLLTVNTTSGPLPTVTLASNASNSPQDASALSVCVTSPIPCEVLSTGVLTVHTEGSLAPGHVKSTADVFDVNALTGILTAGEVYSECDIASNGAASGFTTLTAASLDGSLNLDASPGPNTQIALTGLVTGTLTLNEQIYDSNTNTLTVNAIHIHLTAGSFGTGDIIISHVECDALPAGPAPVIPESPLAILLPISALVVLGGTILVTIRRRTALERG
jgi:hypothetical protein